MTLKNALLITILMFITMITLMLIISDMGSGKTWIVDDDGSGDFQSIQQAVDNASAGDTIRVHKGTYYENVLVNKTLTLIGKGTDKSTIDGNGSDTVMELTEDNIHITGFDIINSENSFPHAGIAIRSNGNTIENCNVSSNYYGIYVRSSDKNSLKNNTCLNNTIGIRVFGDCARNIILKNNCSFNDFGIQIILSDTNSIIDNSCTGNKEGIQLRGSKFNMLKGNRLIGNGLNILSTALDGSSTSDWSIQTIDTTNTIDGKPIYYYKNSTGIEIPSNASQVIVINCTGVRIESRNLSHVSVGIIIGFSSNITISNTTCNFNLNEGIRIIDSNVTTFYNNSISGNEVGIRFESASNLSSPERNQIFNNTEYGVHALDNEGVEVNASNTWWGKATGPSHAVNNSDGEGDNVTDYVNYSPWLEEPLIDDYFKPSASILSISPENVREGENITFSGNGTAYEKISLYVWRSSLVGEFYNGTNKSFSFDNLPNGTQRIYFKVSDNFGIWSDEVVKTVTVDGIPRADIDTITPNPALHVETINFTGTGKDDDSISRYVWKSSIDGELYNGTVNGFMMGNLSNGTHVVSFMVQDNNGTWSIPDYRDLTINGMPYAKIVSIFPNPALDVETVEFRGNGTDDESIVRYRWISSIDGEFYNGSSDSFVYDDLSNGTHIITFRVLDNNGTWSDEVSASIFINGKPVAWIETITPNPALDVDTIQFSGKGNDDGSITLYVWNSSLDGEFFNSSNSLFYINGLSNGTHTIIFKVRDNSGTWSDEVNETLTVNGKPIAWIDSISPSPALDIDDVHFVGNASDDGSIARYAWNSSLDGEFYNGTEAEFSYGRLSNGTHTITFRVQDNNGTWSDTVTAVLVINGRPVARVLSILPNPALDVEIVEFRGNGTDDGNVTRYEWRSSADGVIYDGANDSFSFADLTNGTHKISIRVQDNNGTWSEAVEIVLHINGKPVATIEKISPDPALEMDTVRFEGSGTDDGSIIRYVWESSIDGEFYDGPDPSTEYQKLSNGTHIITFFARDNNGSWSQGVSYTLTVNGKPRAIIESISPSPALDVDSIHFAGNGTDDGSIIRYSWNSSLDGEFYNGTNASFYHNGLSNGTHTIVLRILDNNGSWSSGVLEVLTIDGKPVAWIESISPSPALDTDNIDFVGNASDDGTIVRYLWNSSLDGVFYSGSSSEVTYGGLSNGTHTISLRVKDNNGTWSEEITAFLTVNGKPRTRIESIIPNPAMRSDEVRFIGNATEDGTIELYVWSSDRDGEIYRGPNASFVYGYLSNGTHNITFRVRDNNGTWSDNVSTAVEINGRPACEIVSVSPNPALVENPVRFEGLGSDDGSIVRYSWYSSVDGEFYNNTGAIFQYDLLSEGTHKITLRVRDDRGAWSDGVEIDLTIHLKPVANIIEVDPVAAVEGDTIYLEWEGTDDGSVVRYLWESSMDGEFYDGTETSMYHDQFSNGSHTLSLRVQDNDGEWSDPVSVTLDVNGIPRAAIVSILPNPAMDTDIVHFKAGGTDDGTISRYRWVSSMDGELHNDTMDELYVSDLTRGVHTIHLMIQDDEGLWSEELTVALRIFTKPEANIVSISPDPVLVTEEIEFMGNTTNSESAVTFVWRSSLDGEFYNGTNRTLSYSMLSNGTHTIFFKVKSNFGAWSDEVSQSLRVYRKPTARIVSITPNPSEVGVEVRFQGQGDAGDGIIRYLWRSSIDAKIHDGPDPSFNLSNLSAGEHTILLNVQTENGFWSDETIGDLEVIVPNKRPSVEIIRPVVETQLDGKVRIRLAASDIDGEIAVVEISIDNGSWSTVNGTDEWVYIWDTENVENGQHEIRVRSYDGEDYSDIITISVTVENEDETPGVVVSIVIAFIVIALVAAISLYLFKGKKSGGKQEKEHEKEKKEGEEKEKEPEEAGAGGVEGRVEKEVEGEVEGEGKSKDLHTEPDEDNEIKIDHV